MSNKKEKLLELINDEVNDDKFIDFITNMILSYIMNKKKRSI